jgi:oligopeptide transport system ATP-binding protein
MTLTVRIEPDNAVEVSGLRKVFRRGPSFRARGEAAMAVDDVSFTVAIGESLAIVGESGSGKTTIARMLVGLEEPTEGIIRIAGRERLPRQRLSRTERGRRGREIQIVFQDPYASLDPRQTARQCISEVLNFHFGLRGTDRERRASEVLEHVGLDGRLPRAYPREMSGGQRQRLAIARALAAQPQVLLLDESVAALDVSIQAQILNLLADIREQTSVSLIFISHDLAVVRQVSDRTVIMRHGRIVEEGRTRRVLDAAQHPYTRWLLASVPRPGWKPSRAVSMAQAVSDADPGQGDATGVL